MTTTPGLGMFSAEYEREMAFWLRRRLRYLCIAYIVFESLALLAGIIGLLASPPGDVMGPLGLLSAEAVISLGVLVYFLYTHRFDDAGRDELLRAAVVLILMLGGISLAMHGANAVFFTAGQTALIGSLFYWHFTACLFLPWRPRESLRPILPLLATWALVVVFTEASLTSPYWLMKIMASPLILLPGLAIAAWRIRQHGRRFRSRMIGRQFISMHREIQRARGIHESMFPRPQQSDAIRLDYAYTPMKELGGDYIHLHFAGEHDDNDARDSMTENHCPETLHVTVLDVTGHGLAAALTVNRVFGEIERIRAEQPKADPGTVLRLLNHYFYLTLARHSIFATAVCMTIDARAGEVAWASAGHPPGFLRGANGVVTDLPATGLMLGAVADDEYAIEVERRALTPGDVIVLYTDGAFEATNRRGEHFGIDRLRNLLRGAPQDDWSKFLADRVAEHNRGRSDDDVLIAAVKFNGSIVAGRQIAAAGLASAQSVD